MKFPFSLKDMKKRKEALEGFARAFKFLIDEIFKLTPAGKEVARILDVGKRAALEGRSALEIYVSSLHDLQSAHLAGKIKGEAYATAVKRINAAFHKANFGPIGASVDFLTAAFQSSLTPLQKMELFLRKLRNEQEKILKTKITTIAGGISPEDAEKRRKALEGLAKATAFFKGELFKLTNAGKSVRGRP